MSLIKALLAFLSIVYSFIELRLFEDEGDESRDGGSHCLFLSVTAGSGLLLAGDFKGHPVPISWTVSGAGNFG